MSFWKTIFVASLLLVGTAGPVRAAADDSGNREYQVKAAMIVNFAQFVEWPQEAFSSKDAPLIIAIVGNNPFGNVLEQLVNGKTIAGHSVAIRYYSTPASFGDCHVLFVATDSEGDLRRVLQQIGDKPVLSISQNDAFLNAGGIIRFYTEDNKVRFEISPDAAEKVRLKISSKLMKLARVYKK